MGHSTLTGQVKELLMPAKQVPSFECNLRPHHRHRRGSSDDTIRATIAAGANAITYTPPTTGALFAKSMENYRNAENVI